MKRKQLRIEVFSGDKFIREVQLSSIEELNAFIEGFELASALKTPIIKEIPNGTLARSPRPRRG